VKSKIEQRTQEAREIHKQFFRVMEVQRIIDEEKMQDLLKRQAQKLKEVREKFNELEENF
jgi:hypothetical protein